ncbi:DUF4181 domain-containing protein [Bacillus cereus]|uniref:DUF4181 domain-containing protein n=1 Tax=Bacillus cereus TaxID=1396 RepID=UPI0020D2364C|nr:DUF4181 domain-containing protein [Bacillus cereus]
MTKVTLLILWIISIFVFEKIARKRLNIPKQKGWDNQYVNKTHKWGSRIIIFSYIVVIAISAFLPNRILMGYVPLLFLITLYGFQSYMEWKHDKESREFLISLFAVAALLITGIIIYFFL